MHKTHVVYAGPNENGFLFALLQELIGALKNKPTEINLLDLYRRDFDPVLSPAELREYYRPGAELVGTADMVGALKQCNTLFFVFPVWMYSMPAILKGYFDKVWRPNVTFELVDGAVRPLLENVTGVGVVCTGGQRQPRNGDRDLNEQLFSRLIDQNMRRPVEFCYLQSDDRDARKGVQGPGEQDVQSVRHAVDRLLSVSVRP